MTRASSRTAFHASPYLLLSLTSLFWSLNWVVGRAVVGHISPFALTFERPGRLALTLSSAWTLVVTDEKEVLVGPGGASKKRPVAADHVSVAEAYHVGVLARLRLGDLIAALDFD